MPNPKMTVRELQYIQSDIEICNMIINLIDTLCMINKEFANSYMLKEVKEELQYMVETKKQQIKLDKRTHK